MTLQDQNQDPADLQWRRLRKLNLVGARFSYLSRVTIIDRVLSKTLLNLIPPGVTPNAITMFRFASIPVIAYLLLTGATAWGFWLFILSALSDALDGALARTGRQITKWGIVADPIADKLLIGSVSAIVISKYISWQLAAAIIAIELFLVTTAYFRYRGKLMPAKTLGKIKMTLQCVGVGLVLLYAIYPVPEVLILGRGVLYLAVVFALGSLMVYRSI